MALRIQVAEDGLRLLIEDVRTGERLLTSVEEEAARRAAEKRAEQAEERAEQEVEARRQAEERAEQEVEEARRKAEERAEQGLRRKVEDLCGLLGIEWTAERSTVVASMDLAQLEALWADLLSRKRWP